ncbi:MAG: hypothetical protein GDA56_19195 [Hormoscilla sp. GM7CHS1pb]|nr:hypothetical protein [Hormoscilla sp. GM7CHS1pb]
MQRRDSRIAYSDATREYLRRRVWRTLKQLGEEESSDYVKMAVGILLTYSDDDAEAVKESIFYRWDRSNWTSTQFRRHWDAYAGYLTFNHILYENSPRYVLMPNSRGGAVGKVINREIQNRINERRLFRNFGKHIQRHFGNYFAKAIVGQFITLRLRHCGSVRSFVLLSMLTV